MLFHENPIVLDFLGLDHPVDGVDFGLVEEDLDIIDAEHTRLAEEAMLEGISVRKEQEDEVVDLVSFLENETRPMYVRDD